ncbi:type III secretion system inner membrane ring lipoprotein SctJ [Pseudomonas fluorescens]|uniref:type III secretion system inner membrane ring lipoprotein SctJ n=1 Tax=Pseudomonas fluorescens TaxID=294 RepID=UPI002034A999|nr:type III secretion inner membrane ring lipoprotein SctJ [Pseudomonas fluorescens]
MSAIISLMACSERVELHRDLANGDANELLAELSDKQIDATKRLDKNGVTVLVLARDISRAVRVLEAAGLPRRLRANLGDIFRKEGVISSPLEERARYIYALSQELEHTLTQINGVIMARVHVVLAERIAPGESVQSASAAVFIKHRPELDPDSVTPRIRRMVASSIPGIIGGGEKNLAVVFVLAPLYEEKGELGVWRERDVGNGSSRLWIWILGALLFGIMLAGLIMSKKLSLRAKFRERNEHH